MGAGAVAVVLPGMGNGGVVLGVAVTCSEAVVSVGAAGLVVLPKSAGSSTLLSAAQVLGSTPSGQQ